MIDLGISKLALIGAVALIVIGPEKLPRVARTVGQWVGKAQRYVADMKAEVNRSVELDELKKMKETMETAAREVEQSAANTSSEFDKAWADTTAGLSGENSISMSASGYEYSPLPEPAPEYQHPNKRWRVKRGAVPQWYKARAQVRGHVQSGAARVARFRPR
jgi:sec-independent protein translocase protein TatB